MYIAETMLPTKHGNFRLRGYKHSVRAAWAGIWGLCTRGIVLSLLLLTYVACFMQIDGGKTFVEPTAIICGRVEGQENVSSTVECHVCMHLLLRLHALAGACHVAHLVVYMRSMSVSQPLLQPFQLCRMSLPPLLVCPSGGAAGA